MNSIISASCRRFAGLSLLLLAACGPKLTMEGARVKVAASLPAATCTAISTLLADGGSREKAEIVLRNKAGEMSANALVISETAENDGRYRLVGQAYGCHDVPNGL